LPIFNCVFRIEFYRDVVNMHDFNYTLFKYVFNIRCTLMNQNQNLYDHFFCIISFCISIFITNSPPLGPLLPHLPISLDWAVAARTNERKTKNENMPGMQTMDKSFESTSRHILSLSGLLDSSNELVF